MGPRCDSMSDYSGRIAIVSFTILLVISAVASYFLSNDILMDYGLIILLVTLLNITAGIAAASYIQIMRNKPYDPLDSILDPDMEKKRFRPSLWSRTS